MRERMLLVAMGLAVGCGSAAPTAPSVGMTATAVAPTREMRLPGWPSVEVPASEVSPDFEALTVRVSNALEAAPPQDSELGEWAVAQRALHEDILRSSDATAPSSLLRALHLALDAALLENVYRVAVDILGSSMRIDDVAPAVEVLGTCVEPRNVDPLRAFVARCDALRRYWVDWQAWRAGPVWPEGCENTETGIEEITDHTSLGRPALFYEVRSLRPTAEEQALVRAASHAFQALVGDVELIGAREIEAARRATHTLRGLDGSECAMPPSVEARLAHAHPRLWVGSIDAHCPSWFHSEAVCSLSVTFTPISGSAEGLPGSRSIDLAGEPTLQEFVQAFPRLAAAPIDEEATRLANSAVGIYSPPPGEALRIEGYARAIAAPDIESSLHRIRSDIHACRDLDLSVPRGFSALLDLDPTGAVRGAQIDRGVTTGAQRGSCLASAFRNARFPQSEWEHREVTVYGTFALRTPVNVMTRIHSDDLYASWATDDPRVLERIQACVGAETEVRVINASVHIEPNGVASHAQGDASDATTTCLQNALIGSVWPCSGARDVAMRLCVGNPPAPPEPVRP